MRGCESRRSARGRGRRDADRGFVTAEAALALPVLVMVTALLVSGLIAVLLQIQCVDAARSGARAAARQDPSDEVTKVVRGIAPRGATITVVRQASQVRVVVVARTPLPFELRAEAMADVEGGDSRGNGGAGGEADAGSGAEGDTGVTDGEDTARGGR